jgi:phospholipid/cholesterol/gamma-HCH transport system substrate-binding protein
MQNKKNAAEPFVRRHRPFFVGLFVTIPVLAVPALLVFTILKSDGLQKRCTLNIICENSQGLKRGNQVSMSGIPVGHVQKVDLIKEKEVYISFNINSRYKHLVKKDTHARLRQRGFVGDWEIELAGGGTGIAEVSDGDTLRSERAATMDEIIEVAVNLIDTAAVLLSELTFIARDINSGEGTVGRLLKDDTLYRQISQISIAALGVTSDVRRLLAATRGVVGSADSLLVSLKDVSAGVGASGLTLVDSLMTLVNTVNKSFDDIGQILNNLKTASGDAPELMERLKEDLDEAELLIKSLQNNWLFKKALGPDAHKNPHLTEKP